jgi:hypothetical protein
MKTFFVKSLAALALASAAGMALAQEVVIPGPISGGGVSGSAGLGIDMAASNTPGANHEKAGGLANAIERAFGTPNADCGKLKCD